MAIIEILCGCGWGNLAYEIEDGDIPVCPCCWHEFPEFNEAEYAAEN